MKKTNTFNLNMNVIDRSKKITLFNIEIYWRFTMQSLFILMNDFDYKSEGELNKDLKDGNIYTILRVFYSGILWDEEEDKPSFERFLMFYNAGYDLEKNEEVLKTSEFVIKNLSDYLFVNKDDKKKDKKSDVKDGKDEGINFDRMVLASRINLNIKDDEFWTSSPRKIYSQFIEYNNMYSKDEKEEKKTMNGDDLEKMLSGF